MQHQPGTSTRTILEGCTESYRFYLMFNFIGFHQSQPRTNVLYDFTECNVSMQPVAGKEK